MDSQELTNQESLNLISDMILKAKRSIAKGGSFYFLLWGFTCSLANFGHYFLGTVVGYDAPYIVWLIAIPAIIATIIYSVRRGKSTVVTTHFDRIYGQVWMAIGIAMICTLVFMHKVDFNHNAIILLLAACGTYISGRMLQFMPLIIGGIVLFIAGCVAFNFSPENQNLIAGVALILGYLVPGFMLKSQESE